MTNGWRRTSVMANDGHRLVVYCWRDYEVALNINEGRSGWHYEVVQVGPGASRRFIAQTPTLAAARAVAEDDAGC